MNHKTFVELLILVFCLYILMLYFIYFCYNTTSWGQHVDIGGVVINDTLFIVTLSLSIPNRLFFLFCPKRL